MFGFSVGMASHTRRAKAKVDYAALSKGIASGRKRKDSDSSEELDYNDDIDLHVEEELVSDLLEEEDSSGDEDSLEEGECESDSGEETEEKHIQRCLETGNLEELKGILKSKEQRC